TCCRFRRSTAGMSSRACFRHRSRRASRGSAAIRSSCWSCCCLSCRRSASTSLATSSRRWSTALHGACSACSASARPMLHGWIILDKPLGLGSTQAVSAIKRLLREAGEPKTKVGHGGTLDPLASGVLPIALGEATKVAGRMLDASKEYAFTLRFGEETDTLDGEGKVIATSHAIPTAEEVQEILPGFTGAISQVPPAYSALKIGGKAAYTRARAGEDVELNPRPVTIHEWRLISDSSNEASLLVTVSKGTYVRSLARDIARALNSVGHVTM